MTRTLVDHGYTDIHCHGGGGFYFSDSNVGNISRVIEIHREHGTTNLLASLVTAPIPDLLQQIKRLLPFYHRGEIAGIHLEGPYLAHRRCGAHDPALLREPRIKEIEELVDAAEGAMTMFTIAPELPGALDAIRYISENHIIAAIGHSDGSYEDAKAGLDAGATVVTHFSNGMSKLRDGDHTFATAVIDDPRATLELIVDGHHLPLEEVKELFDRAGKRIILITDAMSAAGQGDGSYRIGGLDVEVRNGVARLTSNGSLAGSTLTMDKARAITESAGVSHEEVDYSSATLPLALLKRL